MEEKQYQTNLNDLQKRKSNREKAMDISGILFSITSVIALVVSFTLSGTIASVCGIIALAISALAFAVCMLLYSRAKNSVEKEKDWIVSLISSEFQKIKLLDDYDVVQDTILANAEIFAKIDKDNKEIVTIKVIFFEDNGAGKITKLYHFSKDDIRERIIEVIPST